MAKCTSCRAYFKAELLKNGRPYKCCPTCRAAARTRSDQRRKSDPDGDASYHREMRRQYRQEAFDAYGGRCACCGIDDYEFLTIDHPNGGGRREREETFASGGAAFARLLARRGYPPGYRVLCHNCNSAHGYYGHCPHDNDRPRQSSPSR